MKTPKTHDYTKREWGHDYTINGVRNGGMDISMMGWGNGIEAGDYMLLQSQSSEPGAKPDTRYQTDIRYPGKPLLLALRGRWKAKAGDDVGAVADFEAVVRRLPLRWDIWEDYATCLRQSGQVAAAEAALGRARAAREW